MALEKKQNITLIPDTHNNEFVVGVQFAYNSEIINLVKSFEGAKWSQSKKYWYFMKDDFQLNYFFEVISEKAYIDYSSLSNKISSEQKVNESRKAKGTKPKLPQAYYDILDQKRYSENTRKTYVNLFCDYIYVYKYPILVEITPEEINQYILSLIREKDISPSQQNQRINSIKFYYEKVLGREKQYFDISRPKRSSILPNVLSTNEIKLIIDHTKNIKHKCIISLLYSAGLRRSELISLQINDVLSDQMQIKIRNSKGNKDRYVGLSNQLLKLLRDYFLEYRPKVWIIEGSKGKKYSGESILKVVKNAARNAGIKRNITSHMLRHSFATHHLESGTDLRYIQEFLGHNNSKTTEIYTHVAKTDFSKFKNPLDAIYENNDL
jgi:integrase/recombinase XerD